MKALILSGGTGTRLQPLTYTNAKQLLPIANKPILHYIIEKVVKAGIRDIGIIVGDTYTEIIESVGYGEQWNATITYIFQDQPLGLAHAVKTASEFLGKSSFLMILGDNLFNMELNGLIAKFKKAKANALVLLHQVQDPSQFGVAVIENDKIVRLVEKPKGYISDLIITGVYIFDKSIFKAIDNIKPSARGELEITDAIQKLLDSGGNVTYDFTSGWWKDTGNLSSILEANQLVLNEMKSEFLSLPDKSSICTGKVYIGENVTISSSIINGPVAIGDNSVISESYIGPHTSLGTDVTINKSKIGGSIVLSGTQIDNIYTKITDSLIGKNAVIKGINSGWPSISVLIGDKCEVNIQNGKIIP